MRFVNDYAQGVHEVLRADPDLQGISVGSHAEHERLMIVGEPPNARALTKIAELLEKHPPGVPVHVAVTLASAE